MQTIWTLYVKEGPLAEDIFVEASRQVQIIIAKSVISCQTQLMQSKLYVWLDHLPLRPYILEYILHSFFNLIHNNFKAEVE